MRYLQDGPLRSLQVGLWGPYKWVTLTVYPWYLAGVLGWNSWGLKPLNTHYSDYIRLGISHYEVTWDRGTSLPIP